MLYIGLDDTDSREGGCTTWLSRRVREAFPDCSEARPPRLVRLNPNVPWKTRGNAALALALDDRGGALALDDALARVERVVRAHARLGTAGTEPGIVVSRRVLDPSLYERAVRGVVSREDALARVEDAGGRALGLAGGRGVIGAAAALAWAPRDRTFEAIAYRARERWGTPRVVPESDVAALESRFPATFDSYDPVEREVVMVPSSPCPVLWGVRAEDARSALDAAASVGGERADEIVLFESNQATDDHLAPATCAGAEPLASAVVDARVAREPREAGGHVFAEIADASGSLRVAAYAPTRSFRRVVAALAPGDVVRACGGVKTGPDGARTLALEKLAVVDAARVLRKVGNPACPACGRAMKSAGRRAGYRCRACGTREGAGAARRLEAARPAPGWFEVPACARRHLAKPLKRGLPAFQGTALAGIA